MEKDSILEQGWDIRSGASFKDRKTYHMKDITTWIFYFLLRRKNSLLKYKNTINIIPSKIFYSIFSMKAKFFFLASRFFPFLSYAFPSKMVAFYAEDAIIYLF
jgi:hypothetical protein